MDQMQASTMPHIVQVYPPACSNAKIQNPQIIHISHPNLATSQGKITYQQTISTESLHIPVSDSQNVIMSCQQTHLHNIQPVSMQSQILQSSDMSQPLQFTSHVILPQVPMFKQHMVMDGSQPYYGQYDMFLKEQHCIVAKVEAEIQTVNEKHVECKTENSAPPVNQNQNSPEKKRSRSQVSNPNNWACNVRKVKHQRGEAYITRRGKYMPERHIKNTKDCLTSCKYRCNERIGDADRELIFKAFYSLNANEKRHFLLNTTERHNVKQSKNALKRQYTFRYFFLVRAVKYTVCKNFYLGTLAISQKPVYNVHLSKSEMNIPKPDGRGLSAASIHAVPSEVKERVRLHIQSFKTVDSKTLKQFSRKKQYLEPSLNIKQMYNMYLNECGKENAVPVRESMYRKILRQEYNVHFRKVKAEQLCAKCKEPINQK